MKTVMKVEMYGKTLIVRQFPGKQYEFRVYELVTPYRTKHLDSFESFQEAYEFVTCELWG